jgi:hypothetical protein
MTATIPYPQPQPQPQPQPEPTSGARMEPPMVYVPPTWEYMSIERPSAADQMPSAAELNEFGAQGWELAGVAQVAGSMHFYFKRPVE